MDASACRDLDSETQDSGPGIEETGTDPNIQDPGIQNITSAGSVKDADDGDKLPVITDGGTDAGTGAEDSGESERIALLGKPASKYHMQRKSHLW